MTKKTIGTIIIVVIVAALVHYYRSRSPAQEQHLNRDTGASQVDISSIPSYNYSQTYTSSVYGFSFKYPEGFRVTEIPGGDQNIILVGNVFTSIGMQIMITPYSPSKSDLTEEDVRTNIPDMKVEHAQPLSVDTGEKGLSFESDNENFGGDSREIWFVHSGHIFQLSTFAQFGLLLKGIFDTWKFN